MYGLRQAATNGKQAKNQTEKLCIHGESNQIPLACQPGDLDQAAAHRHINSCVETFTQSGYMNKINT